MEANNWRVTIPLPPVATARPRFTRAGGVHAYDKQSRSRRAFGKALQCCSVGELLYFHGPLELILLFNIPRPRSHYGKGKNSRKVLGSAPTYPSKSDVDNYTKFVMDCLNKRLFEDDRQVVRLVAEKRFSKDPSTEIEIREISL